MLGTISRTLGTLIGIFLLSGWAGATAIKSFAQALQEYHVSLTKESLVAALQHSDPSVRSLAASQLLVVDRAVDTVPAVERALQAESSPNEKLNMAWALVHVSASLGIETLQATCSDKGTTMGWRLKAVQYMLDFGNQACLDTVTEALQGDLCAVALSMLPKFKSIPQEKADTLSQLILLKLGSDDPQIRSGAARALAWLGRPAAIPYLRTAASAEQEDFVRVLLQTAIGDLEQKGR